MIVQPRRFRFLPVRRVFPYAAGILGVLLVLAGVLAQGGPWLIGLGLVGIAAALGYHLSPGWQLAVVVDESGVALHRGTTVRFEIPWAEVAHLVHAPSTKTCFVDAGDAARRVVVPGADFRAPYRIEDAEELYDLLVARVPGDKQLEVPSLRDVRFDQGRPVLKD